MNYDELKEAARIKLPVAAQKTTIYTPELPHLPWVATTNSDLTDGEHNERDEARAKLIALALNHHDELVATLQKLYDCLNYGAKTSEAFTQAHELLYRIQEEK